MAVDAIVWKESRPVGRMVISVSESGVQLVVDPYRWPQVETDMEIQCGAKHLIPVMSPKIGTKDNVVVERPSFPLVDMVIYKISQRKALSYGAVLVAFVGVVDDAVEGVVGIADQETMMAFPNAQIESIMMVIGDVLMLFAKRSVVADVETGLKIE